MKEKSRTEILLEEIMEKAGVTYLSDLKQIRSVKYLFTVFQTVSHEDYTIDEWKAAISYIFRLEQFSSLESLEEGIILWNMGQWGQYITQTIEKYYARCNKSGSFYHITGHYGPKLSPDKKYLMFYPASEVNREEVRDYAIREKLNICFAAICSDYHDGMQAMNNGDRYALKLPLEEDKVIRCYQHFSSNIEKKEIQQ